MAEKSIENEVVSAIIDRLGLDVAVAEIDIDAPIFAALAEGTEFEESSLNLDSIDILEVVLALNSAFDIDIPDNQQEIFTSVRTIAEFVRTQRPEAG
jgi:acyl carrier protein